MTIEEIRRLAKALANAHPARSPKFYPAHPLATAALTTLYINIRAEIADAIRDTTTYHVEAMEDAAFWNLCPPILPQPTTKEKTP